ncbi:B12-binding domain-containing radical SAM protein [Aurantibacter aestuarii]|uniref:B12-binding domain-containing radical SAM protein n=1 Tax=Aurantibacter aestuarii TaxID=1266046 RepID=A0A2T1NCN3_9FLAO|nr:radical SAM protein [Aurantibacter aestuarii]PSG90201.1 B12-binding domain-containing radical SAM protein [Aurantibacter aestuarii]
MKKNYKVILISMSGVRVYNKHLLELGLTLPGFVERSEVIASLPSLGLLTLASHTPENWNIVYKELDNYSESDILEIISENPDIIAFSSLTARINETYELCKRFKKIGITVAIGGLHVSAMPEEATKFADVIIQGEGEIIWETILKDFESNELKSIYSSLSNPKYTFNFKSCKVPKYELLDISKYNRLTIQTTRGCPLNCSFCAASRTISAYKKKSIAQIEKELNKILEVWERPFIELADDNTFVDKKWSIELLNLFGKYKIKWFTETDISIAYDDELLELLAKSNCAQVLIGFETVNKIGLKGIDRKDWKHKQFDNYFKAINKIQSYGISVNGCFILGFDTDTKDTFKETEQFIINSNLSEVQITLLTPFPGTELYNQLKSQNRLLQDNYWDKCTLFDVNFIPKNFSVEELEREFEVLMQRVYSKELVTNRKKHFKQTLLNKRQKKNI